MAVAGNGGGKQIGSRGVRTGKRDCDEYVAMGGVVGYYERIIFSIISSPMYLV
jgi:hypothetical protein